MHSISIVGIGRAGGALALALDAAGFRIDNIVFRAPGAASKISELLPKTASVAWDNAAAINSELVLIATRDQDIEGVARGLVAKLAGTPIVLHTSGSLSSEILQELASAGCPTGSLHPLVSLSDPIVGSKAFANSYFCIEGAPAATEAARSIVTALGGKPFSIDREMKALYHAAAVTACGHLVALIDVSIEMLSKCGIAKDDGKKILLPLIESTVANLRQQSPAEALTGSFARADVAAYERHIKLIEQNLPEDVRAIYLELGERSLELAEANGADGRAVAELRDRISIAKRKSEC